MAQVTGRINLSARAFPLVAQNWGRTVIVSSSVDNNFNRQVQSTEDVDHDVGVPQAYYMHNVMPHAQGFQSVGYGQIIGASPDGHTDWLYVRELHDDLGNYALLGIGSDGVWYIWEPAFPTWIAQFASAAPTKIVYVADINGVSYCFQQGQGLYYYSWTTHSFQTTFFTGLNAALVIGITSAFGYMIAWTAVSPIYTLGATTITGNVIATITSGSVASAQVGDIIVSANFPAGTLINHIDPVTPALTLSAAATATSATTIVKATASPGGVFWSSTLSELDFTPSLITGAGGGEVQGATGTISFCLPQTKGFVVYTNKNAIGATYTGNARYPFDFQVIVGAGGITDYSLVTLEGNSGNHYAYTTSGLQLVSMGAAQNVLPEITDFISGKLFEDFNDTTQTFSLTTLTQTMVKQLRIVSNRYLLISYGIAGLTHSLVYDVITQRFGKLKIPHVYIFEVAPQVTGVITDLPRQNIGILQANGLCQVVDFDVHAANSNGTLILGKYQYVRARNLILDQLEIENIYSQSLFALTIMTSLDGKSFSSLDTPYLTVNSGGQAQYNCRSEGQNLSLLLQGQFHLESGILSFNLGGKR